MTDRDNSPQGPTPAQGLPTREELAETIGRSIACMVSGNNQPHMSGDPRNRLSPLKRRHFDEACDNAAEAVLARLHAPAARTQVEQQRKTIEELNGMDATQQTCVDAIIKQRDEARALVEGKPASLALALSSERERRVKELHNDALPSYLCGFDDATEAALAAVSSTSCGPEAGGRT